MFTASSFSLLGDSKAAAQAAAEALEVKLGRTPHLVVLYATEHHARPETIDVMRSAFPSSQIIGGTSCAGVMTEQGFHAGPDGALGLFGIHDEDGAYGVGSAPVDGDPVRAGALAVERALAAAGRDFETPDLVWCCQPPGSEEGMIKGVQSVLGANTPVVGGSAADETIGGRWRQFSSEGVLEDHVAVCVMFPGQRFGLAFQSGYAPASSEGVVTRADGRRLIEIDGRPAAEVYAEWTGLDLDRAAGGMILALSTPTPLGRLAGEARGVPMFILSHPATVDDDGTLSLFTEIGEGERVHLMRGSPDSLVRRAGLVARDATSDWGPQSCAGGLIIYCGGCMLHVRERMDEVADDVSRALAGAAFLGAFTFGEQGAIVDACNRHGNLMVAALAFT